ncbi:uncharacterized protein ARMOST_03780 [Armillaria ostoyae]|uniref:Uncharacterized protein n=1 Tax=Armillaria ostoyae TaxID=47428 RepID=A0A284QVG6_ARMOS|nr:uncharacterized protein ARMOST_03780 [Armillaria ostoyae]
MRVHVEPYERAIHVMPTLNLTDPSSIPQSPAKQTFYAQHATYLYIIHLLDLLAKANEIISEQKQESWNFTEGNGHPWERYAGGPYHMEVIKHKADMYVEDETRWKEKLDEKIEKQVLELVIMRAWNDL